MTITDQRHHPCFKLFDTEQEADEYLAWLKEIGQTDDGYVTFNRLDNDLVRA